MGRLSERKIIMVVKRTRMEELIARHGTAGQARFHLESLGGDFADIASEDERYRAAVKRVGEACGACGRLQVLGRDYLPNFIFGADDVVVTVGPDGLVANTLKYLSGQPLAGVNPDPDRWDGVLALFRADEAARVIADMVAGRRGVREVTMAKATLGDGQELLAVNDIFIGRRTHVSARYRIIDGVLEENQSSSGVIVSTGLGSTGWLAGVMAGAEGITGLRSARAAGAALAWDAGELQYSVREPFPSKNTGASIVSGRVGAGRTLRIVSQMAEEGVIFSDGMERDCIDFPAGAAAEIGVAPVKGRLVI